MSDAVYAPVAQARRLSGVCVAAGVLAVCPAVAVSQGIEEIIVTAQKREQSLQDTPISVSAFDSNILDQLGIADTQDIGRFTPNLQAEVNRQGSGVGANFFIRGVGQLDSFITADPGVGVYIDGIYHPHSIGMVFDLFDIERVEVLRGPQGTLYGKNTIGGAVNVITRKPDDEFGGSVQAGYGNYNHVNLRGTLNVPLSDSAAVRLTGFASSHDGWMENLNGPDTNDKDVWGARLAARLEPTDRLLVEATAEYVKADGRAHQGRNVLPSSPDVEPFTLGPGENPYRGAEYFIPGSSGIEIVNASLTLDYDLGDVTVRSLTGYRAFKNPWLTDLDATPLDLLRVDVVDDHDAWSQELQLTGLSLDGRLDWLLGAFYFRHDASHDEEDPVFGGLVVLRLNQQIETKSVAYFGHASYALTPRLNVNGGLRYTKEDRFLDQFFEPFSGTFSASWSSVTPKIGVDFEVTDEAMVFMSYSEGFKGGQLNGRASSDIQLQTPVDPEEVKSYEIGAKTRWLDGRLQLNAAAFLMRYEDIQVQAFRPNPLNPAVPILVLQNAAEAEMKGAELELVARPTQALTINASMSVLDAEYKEYFDGLQDRSGLDLPMAPSFTGALAVQYRQDLGARGGLTWVGNYSYSSSLYTEADNLEVLKQRSHGIYGARVSWQDVDSRWRVSAWGNNLGDKVVIRNGFPGLPSGTTAFFTAPRTYGVTVDYSF